MPLSNMKQIKSKGMKSTVEPDNQGPVIISPEDDRNLMISRAAYYRALARGFEPGHEEEDWYAAEVEITEKMPAKQGRRGSSLKNDFG